MSEIKNFTPPKAIDLPANKLIAARPGKRSSTALGKIESESFPAILGRIRAGESQAEIAKSLGVHVATLNRYLNDADRVLETDAAKRDSAEAWLDRGMSELESAKGGDNAEVTRAKAVAQECARRASIRNPRYSEKQQVELSGPDGGPVPQAPSVVVYIPNNGRDGEFQEVSPRIEKFFERSKQ
jgi:transcriptional regulator with XRE-family HTH domain